MSTKRTQLKKSSPKVPKAKTRSSVSRKQQSVSSEQSSGVSQKAHETIGNLLQLGRLQAEKCELQEAEVAYTLALTTAKKARCLRGVMEALSGLLRLAGEALDEAVIAKWDTELDELMKAHPRDVPSLAWHCKGTVAWYRKDLRFAQRCWHRQMSMAREESGERSKSQGEDHYHVGLLTPEESFVKAWLSLALLWRTCHPVRARWTAKAILKRYEAQNFRGMNGIAYLILGHIEEMERQVDAAMAWYQKAHVTFLGEHNWYYHLYALYGYARLSRLQQNFPQCYWYLDLVEKAAQGHYFAQFRREIATERARLQQDAVDLLIDSRRGVIKTREGGHISLRKQYVLLHILEALSNAHSKPGSDMDRGLSKAEIIEQVWNESYRPEAHDNKLYYNINRLRKLLEPDIKKPRYLLNWKEGYRLAPGLRVQFVGGRLQPYSAVDGDFEPESDENMGGENS